MLGRVVAILAIIMGVTAYLSPEPVLYHLLRGLGIFVFLPFEVIPLDTLYNALIVSPPSLSFLGLFLLGTLALGLVELG